MGSEYDTPIEKIIEHVLRENESLRKQNKYLVEENKKLSKVLHSVIKLNNKRK